MICWVTFVVGLLHMIQLTLHGCIIITNIIDVWLVNSRN
jgi:hypothetical protein